MRGKEPRGIDLRTPIWTGGWAIQIPRGELEALRKMYPPTIQLLQPEVLGPASATRRSWKMNRKKKPTSRLS